MAVGRGGPSEESAAAIAICGSRRERAILAAAFPETDAAPPAAIAVWSASRYWPRVLRRADALGIPALLLAPGLLRTPAGWGSVRLLLSLTARAVSRSDPMADRLDPDRLLMSRGWETAALLNRAAAARRMLSAGRIGGAWWDAGALPAGDGLALVFADEPRPRGGPNAVTAMLAAALAENPPQKIVVLASPRISPRGLLADAAARGCTIVERPVDPWAAIERARCIYSVGGEMAFLALIAGRIVRCFGDSFYSGWGETDDAVGVAQKPFRRTIDQIFAGACLLATRCLDPYRNLPAAFEDVAAILAEWRQIEAANRRVAACVGMSFWKRRWIADFFRSADAPPRFQRSARTALAVAAARPGSAIAVWASRIPPGLAAAAARQGTPLIIVEDGFVRSVGLGSDFVPAASLALDASGMHCDAGVRSDLERLLRDTEFDAALLRRARDLIARLVARGVTKYNLDRQRLWPNHAESRGPAFGLAGGRRRILVPGQVEDDLSVRLGGGVRSNLDLLARVRTANPDAYILYKPHPDVEAGHRRGVIPRSLAGKFADAILSGVSTAAVLAEIDELHTLTSLTGFEALLRGCTVVVYGRPFYAGWGLTDDRIAIDRGRRLSLEQLVAGALILYPRYLDPLTRLPCAPEIIVDRLAHPELWRAGPLVAARRLHGRLARQWNGMGMKFLMLVGEPGKNAAARP